MGVFFNKVCPYFLKQINMASYKVIALSMSMGSRKKPAKSGDILSDKDLLSVGINPAEMIQKGFLKKVNSGKVTKEEVKPEELKSEDKAKEKVEESKAEIIDDVKTEETEEGDELLNAMKASPVFINSKGEEVYTEEDCTVKQIKTELEERGIEYDKTANKTVLFALLTA